MTWPKQCLKCSEDMWSRCSGESRVHEGYGNCRRCYRADFYFGAAGDSRAYEAGRKRVSA